MILLTGEQSSSTRHARVERRGMLPANVAIYEPNEGGLAAAAMEPGLLGKM